MAGNGVGSAVWAQAQEGSIPSPSANFSERRFLGARAGRLRGGLQPLLARFDSGVRLHWEVV